MLGVWQVLRKGYTLVDLRLRENRPIIPGGDGMMSFERALGFRMRNGKTLKETTANVFK